RGCSAMGVRSCSVRSSELLGSAACSPKIRSKSADQRDHLFGHSVEFLKFVGVNVTDIEGDVEQRLDFHRRPFSHVEEVSEVSAGLSGKPFCDVAHRRDSGTAGLLSEPIILLEGTAGRHLVNLAHEFPRLLPCLNVLEPPYGCHGGSNQLRTGQLRTGQLRTENCVRAPPGTAFPYPQQSSAAD